MNLKIALLITGLVILLAACSYPELKQEAPFVHEVKVNSKFRINLPEDHNSGYLWQLSSSVDKSLVENLSAVWHGNEKGIDFNFKALAVGQSTFNFVLRKYTDTSNVKNFIIKIVEN